MEGAAGGATIFQYTSRAVNATLIAEGGTNGGEGGLIQFAFGSQGVSARVEVFGNGMLDISESGTSVVSLGSIEGDGIVTLGSNYLTIGTNNLGTTFSGSIQGSGGVTKTGSGTTIVTSESSTYLGDTTVLNGILRVDNKKGTPTGKGTLRVKAGTLAGAGRIFGPVIIGTNMGMTASLAPSAGGSKPAELTTRGRLTLKTGSSYVCQLNTKTGTADEVTAKGIGIESGASFSLLARGHKPLTIGSELTLLNNTSANPIHGTFSNLPDGGTIDAGANRFQANYEGGDGNDLVLTVIE